MQHAAIQHRDMGCERLSLVRLEVLTSKQAACDVGVQHHAGLSQCGLRSVPAAGIGKVGEECLELLVAAPRVIAAERADLLGGEGSGDALRERRLTTAYMAPATQYCGRKGPVDSTVWQVQRHLNGGVLDPVWIFHAYWVVTFSFVGFHPRLAT